ncbi:PAS domain S-box protein [Spirulina subsalsa FACHB-351]|uniref:histidine kinase n=1 Tax=Spirulina subsalsa FACHB-351 TaxID=234711 RepID=A0ABT3L565_9CYAN|nr:PAS domain S-box protein [Spirulina subsalsa]MCW6036652.1 PAS domain S-box protein [Spirulina subsalsa FACHB-351]
MPSFFQPSNSQLTENRLLDNPERLRALADNVLGILYQFKLTPEGTYSFPYISAGIEALLGISPQQIEQDASVMINLTHPEDQSRFEQTVGYSAQTLTVWEWEGRMILPTGEEKWVKAASRPEKQRDGSIVWDGWILDITQSKRDQMALQAAFKRMETILAGSSDGFLALDKQWHFTQLNPMGEKLFGKTQAELLGQNIWDIYSDAIDSPFYTNYHYAVEHRVPVTFEEYYPPFDTWFEVRAYPVGDELFSYFTNINARKQLELRIEEQITALEKTEKRYSLLVEQNPLAVIEWDLEGNVVSWNKTAEGIFGYSAQEVIGFPMLDRLIPAEFQPNIQAIIKALLEQTGGTYSNNENITKDGRRITCDWYNSPLVDETGRVTGIVSLAWDVSDRLAAEKERQTLAAVVRNSTDFLGVANLDGSAAYLNPTGRQMVKFQPEDITPYSMLDFIPSEQHDFLQQEILPTVLKQGNWRGEFYLRNWADDSAIPVDFNLFLVKNPDTGEPICLASATRDISEEKKAKARIQEVQNFLTSVLEALPVGVIAKEAENLRFVLWNNAATALLGHKAEEVIGKNDYDFFTREQADFFTQKDREVLNSGQVLDIPEEAILRGDGETRILHSRKTAVLDCEGNPQYLLAITEDITERKQAEDLLRESEQRLNSILASLQDIVWSACHKTYQLLYINPVAEQIYGRPASDFYENSNLWFEVVHPEDQPQVISGSERLFNQGFNEMEYRILRPDGEERHLLQRSYLVRDETGEILRMDGIARDITEQKLAAQQLRESEQRYQVLADAAPIGVIYTDVNYNCLYVNDRWSKLTGLNLEQSLDQAWTQAIAKSDREKLLQAWNSHSWLDHSFQAECRIQDVNRKVRWVIYQAKPILGEGGGITGYVGTLTDITERKRAERDIKHKAQELEKALQELQQTQTRLIQSEKMSSLGQLVAGIAHEINNPVNFIYGNLEHIKTYATDLQEIVKTYQESYPEPTPEVQDILEELDIDFLLEDLPKTLNSIQVGAKRIRSIVASLRTFSRLDEAECKDVNIHEGLDSTLLILQNRLKAKPESPAIMVHRNYGELPQIQCYAGQLNQVFMNILVNALDSLEERDKNRTYEQIHAQPSVITITTQLLGSREVQIRIKDNGLGIPESVKSRIFDPFFTTKSIGKGTGLGMSISYQIVTERHRGSLECVSEVGQGAEFIITIPVHQRES